MRMHAHFKIQSFITFAIFLCITRRSISYHKYYRPHNLQCVLKNAGSVPAPSILAMESHLSAMTPPSLDSAAPNATRISK